MNTIIEYFRHTILRRVDSPRMAIAIAGAGSGPHVLSETRSATTTDAASNAVYRSPKIEICKVSKFYGTHREETSLAALQDVNMTVEPNEFITLLGRSGCGKTTLLNIIAGLVAPTSGEVKVNGKRVTRPGDGKGMVFQQHALFPWLTAL